MLKRVCLVVVAGIALSVGHALLAQRPPSEAHVVYGHGNASCGSWVSDTSELIRAAKQAWVLGFLSGVGYAGVSLNKTDSDAVSVWMNNYCQAHPLDTISVGAKALVDELTARK
jgi:hypothetical protein